MENTGNFRAFGRSDSKIKPKNLVIAGVFVEIPYSRDRGILRSYQGILSLDQGIFFE